MYFVAGLSYAHTGSLAYPLRTRCIQRVHQATAQAILELVHPDNLGPLPPSPRALAYKGEQMGVISYGEMWRDIWL
jgi:hypothetical protein